MKSILSGCTKVLTLGTLTLALALSPTLARAADTIEEYEPGQVAFELGFSGEYLRAGMKDGAHNALFMSDIVLGYGITRYLSAQVMMKFFSDGRLGTPLNVERMGSVGLFGAKLISTVVDTDMIDLDLMFGFDGTATPGFELNFDFAPMMGAYLRASMPLYGVDKDDAEEGDSLTGLSMDLLLEPGFYVKLREGHQLFLELAFAFGVRNGHGKDADADGYRGTRVSLGYNFKITENIKFLVDLHLTATEGEEDWLTEESETEVDFGVMVGFKSTLPFLR